MPDYKKALKINKYDLINELVRQPQLYMEWVEHSTDAAIERDRLKSKLDIVKAEIEKEIRDDPEEFDLGESPKEGAIKAAIIRHRKVKRAERELREAQRNATILSKAETAFQQRKSMLSALVQLDIRLHFADPKVPRETQDEVNNIERERIKSGLKKPRRIIRRRKNG